MEDTTFLRECTPGYYNNEGRNERDSIWLSNYGGGPFEYMDVLKDWLEGPGPYVDLRLTRHVESAG
jgi:hypothetical protein